MMRVGLALAGHEFFERLRDRWVLIISGVFALLASGISLYGRSAGDAQATLVGPSLVTLASLLVPLVALVLSHDAIVGERERNTIGLLLSLPVGRMEVVLGKFVGRALALALAITAGLLIASWFSGGSQGQLLLRLLFPTLLLGLAFLAIGVLISASVSRQVMAASLVVLVWFAFVFFYDLALLGLLVVTDGGVSGETIAGFVAGNPAGLYRVSMMAAMSGPEVLENLGMSDSLPDSSVRIAIWAAWIVGPVLMSGALLRFRRLA